MVMPELYKDESLATVNGWREILASYGHIGFAIDGRLYFVFPEGPHAYGMCYHEDEATGNHSRWHFASEDDLLNAPLFAGASIRNRLPEILYYDV